MSVSIWGTSGQQSFALPVESATPPNPAADEYILQWDPVTLVMKWVPYVGSDPAAGAYEPLEPYAAGTIGKKLQDLSSGAGPLIQYGAVAMESPTVVTFDEPFEGNPVIFCQARADITTRLYGIDVIDRTALGFTARCKGINNGDSTVSIFTAPILHWLAVGVRPA